MSLLDRFRAAIQPKGAGSKLAPQAPPKVKPKQQGFPGYLTNVTATTARLPQVDLNVANLDLAASFRFGTSTGQVIRNLARVTPDLSAAVSAHLRLGIPEHYIAIAEGPDGQFSLEGTQIAMQLLARWARSPNYDVGFSQTDSLRTLFEAWGKEAIQEGAMAGELVLDKSRLPDRLAPLPVSAIKFYQDDKGLRPVQVIGGEEIDLDFPTFFYVAGDPSLLDPYPLSPLESSIQPVLAFAQFLNDLRKICGRHVYPRLDISIDEEKLRANMPADVQADPALQPDFLNGVISEVENMVNDLGVEEAAVHFDFIKIEYIKGQDGNTPSTFDTVKGIYEAKIATGAKVMPSVVGHGSGSQNVATTETMLAVMTANSLVRLKLQELMSRALTLAVRLYGVEASVSFEFDTIDLRPASELEAFKTMRMERYLNLLSLGLITDEEVCLRLTGKLPPTSYTSLMGTRFRDGVQSTVSGNPYSGSPEGGGQSGGGALNQGIGSKQPKQAKGPAK